jgi:hypothetical protein
MRSPIATGRAAAMLPSASTADFRCRKPSICSPEIGYFVLGRITKPNYGKNTLVYDCLLQYDGF